MAGKKKIKKKRKIDFALLILLVIVLAGSLGATGYLIFLCPGSDWKISGPRVATVHKKPAQVVYEEPVAADNYGHLIIPGRYKEAVAPGKQPLVAIIIDDMGYKSRVPDQLLNLDLDITFSFLPHGPHTDTQMRKAAGLGRDIMLHLPMEAEDSRWDPGPGGIFTTMNKNQLRNVFQEDLATVPLAIGVNNHMGSRFSSDPKAMTEILDIIAGHNLFFVDSLTSAHSVGWKLAREKGMTTAKRNVFLDNDQDMKKITAQLDALVRLARKQGRAIGIGHPYPATLAALSSYQDKLRTRVKVVGVHLLVE